MSEVNVNYDVVFSPNEPFLEYNKKLFQLYVADYGDKYRKKIHNKLSKTIYIFESTPEEEMDFLMQYLAKISDYEKVRRLSLEYEDYTKVKKRLDLYYKNKFYNYVAKAFDVIGFRKMDELVMLDFESCSTRNQELLCSKDISFDIKEDIRLRQEDYIHSCSKLGIEAVTESFKIDRIIRYSKSLARDEYVSLVKFTRWGRRIRKEIVDKSGVNLVIEDLAGILFDNVSSGSLNMFTYGNKHLPICYVPVIRLLESGNLDASLLHENRHAVEVSENCAGIGISPLKKYILLNEVRNEMNAILDRENMGEDFFFSNGEYASDYANAYRMLFPFTGDFFTDNRTILNDIAINNDIFRLEKHFGRDVLLEFDDYLKVINNGFFHDALTLDEAKEKFRKHKQFLKKKDTRG